MKNNKGFTLIELLAVVVVLIIILLIAFNKIKSSTQKSHMNAIKSSALTYVNAVRNLIAEDVATKESLDCCFFTTSDFETLGISISGKKPTSGYFTITDYKIKSFCLEYESSYYLTESSSGISDVNEGKCEVDSIGIDFAYTGSQQEFTASKTGIYKLEVWGAQGGTVNETFIGGYGGYSVAYIDLKKDDKLYVQIGGKGILNGNARTYNGGGDGSTSNGSSGGGATSISLSDGELSTLDKDNVLIVAGGGGGSVFYNSTWASGSGGSAGGYLGTAGLTVGWPVVTGQGGSQTSGGSYGTTDGNSQCGLSGEFGLGGNKYPSCSSSYVAGGGAGYYGGGATRHGGGGGGSGYIGNSKLYNKVMYCYNCAESSEPSTKTISTTCVNKNPTPNCAKENDGYARITYIG